MTVVANSDYPVPPQFWESPDELYRLLSQGIRGLLDGETNNTFVVTLDTNSTTTTVTDPRVGITTVALMTPQSATAAGEMTSVWVTVTEAVLTIHHPSTGIADRVWGVAIFG